MNAAVNNLLRTLGLLLLMGRCAYASGINYQEVSLVEAVSNATYIIQAEYMGEDKDDYGPHSQYRLQKVLYAAEKNTNVNLKVWAAHAAVWGKALAIAEKTGEHIWFTVPEYKGKERVTRPEKGKSYILLLNRLSRVTDFAFCAEGALLGPGMLQEVTSLIERNRKIEHIPADVRQTAPPEK